MIGSGYKQDPLALKTTLCGGFVGAAAGYSLARIILGERPKPDWTKDGPLFGVGHDLTMLTFMGVCSVGGGRLGYKNRFYLLNLFKKSITTK